MRLSRIRGSMVFSLSHVLLPLALRSVAGLDNGLGRTPAMGFNAWNRFRCDVTEDVVKGAALAIKDKGLLDLGYKYINLDDCWMKKERDSEGRLVEDRQRFPSGMKGFGDWLHSQGFQFGIYSSAGEVTCEQYPASLDHEATDARSFADWGVDYLKYDNCAYNNNTRIPEEKYPTMSQALQATGRPMVFSICEWGLHNPGAWAQTLGHSWRTTRDIEDNWASVIDIVDTNARRWRYAGPGHFNDPDMLEVGNGNMTLVEYRSHMSLWAAMKSPLLIGCDVAKLDDAMLAILANREVIAINQDPLGQQARRVWSDTAASQPPTAIAAQCDDSMTWTYDATRGTLRDAMGQCLTRAARMEDNRGVTLEPCGNAGQDGRQAWDYNKGTQALSPRAHPEVALAVFHDPNPKPDSYVVRHEGITLQLVKADKGSVHQRWDMEPEVPSRRLVNHYQGQCLATETDAPPGKLEVWSGWLADGMVVLLFNRGDKEASIRAPWKLLQLRSGLRYDVRDVWGHTSTQLTANGDEAVEASVLPHGVAMFRLRLSMARRRRRRRR